METTTASPDGKPRGLSPKAACQVSAQDTCKLPLVGECGFSLRVAYLLNYVFRIQIESFTNKPRGFPKGTYGIWTDMVALDKHKDIKKSH